MAPPTRSTDPLYLRQDEELEQKGGAPTCSTDPLYLRHDEELEQRVAPTRSTDPLYLCTSFISLAHRPS